jgi:hypothetical protein
MARSVYDHLGRKIHNTRVGLYWTFGLAAFTLAGLVVAAGIMGSQISSLNNLRTVVVPNIETGTVNWTFQWTTNHTTVSGVPYTVESHTYSDGLVFYVFVFFPPPPSTFPIPVDRGAATYYIYIQQWPQVTSSLFYSAMPIYVPGFTNSSAFVFAPAHMAGAVTQPIAYFDGNAYVYWQTTTAAVLNLTVTGPFEIAIPVF